MELKHPDEILERLRWLEEMKRELEVTINNWIDQLEQGISQFQAKVDAWVREIEQFAPLLTDDVVMRLHRLSQKMVSGPNAKVPELTPAALERQQKVLAALSTNSFRTVDEVASIARLKRDEAYSALHSLGVRNPEMFEARTRNVQGRPKEYRRRTSEVVRGEAVE